MHVYPVFLNNLEGRTCVVVGGNHEAERKAQELLECQAEVSVIASKTTPTLARWAEEGRLRWLRRDYARGDLKGAFLVIVAETNPEATAPIWDEAQAEKVLINAMDDVPHCTFVAGSVIRRGPLVLSISTSGCAPALSVRIRQQLEQLFDHTYGSFVSWMGRLREPMARRYPDFYERKRKWYELVDSDALPLLKGGEQDKALARIESIVGAEVASVLHEEKAVSA